MVEPADAGLPADVTFNCFRLTCQCGGNVWKVFGNWFQDTDEFVGPLVVECSRCGKTRRIIDLATDGHNGEIGDGIIEDDTHHDTWICPHCDKPQGLLIACFGYQYEPDAEIVSRYHEYFDAFILSHVCVVDVRPIQVAMFDCA